MKASLLFLLCSLLSAPIHAQVKIGATTAPNSNAVLELESASKGLLLPRVSLTSTTSASPLGAHTAGMVVYNLAWAADVSPGYYYNDGAKWQRLSSSTTAWNIDGNVGTTPGIEFIGTRDAADLAFRTSNTERMRIGADGRFGIGTLPLLNTRMYVIGADTGDYATGLLMEEQLQSTTNADNLFGAQVSSTFISGTTSQTGIVGHGISTRVSASGGNIGTTFGVQSSTFTTGIGSITNSYGFFSATPAGSVGNYHAFHAADIPAASGTTRRAFEYAAASPGNAPVAITATGQMGIGTLTPGNNARLTLRDGHLQSTQSIMPTVFIYASAGSTSGANCVLSNATDVAGKILFTSGSSGVATGSMFAVLFNKPYTVAPIVTLTAADAFTAGAIASKRIYPFVLNTGFQVVFDVTPGTTTTYNFNYFVIETQ